MGNIPSLGLIALMQFNGLAAGDRRDIHSPFTHRLKPGLERTGGNVERDIESLLSPVKF